MVSVAGSDWGRTDWVMKDDTPELVKFGTLKRLLGIDRMLLIGLLESLRLAVRKYAPDGDIGKYSNEEIAAVIEWRGDADALVAALISSDWLRATDDQRRIVFVPFPSYEDSRPCRRWISKAIRLLVMLRDGHKCRYCGGSANTLDHLYPYSRGGEDTPENLVASCRSCNSKKGDRTPLEAGMKLIGAADG